MRGPRLLLEVAGAERAHDIAKECGLRIEIVAYEGETYIKEAPVGSKKKEETLNVPPGRVYVEIKPGVGIPNINKFWERLKEPN